MLPCMRESARRVGRKGRTRLPLELLQTTTPTFLPPIACTLFLKSNYRNALGSALRCVDCSGLRCGVQKAGDKQLTLRLRPTALSSHGRLERVLRFGRRPRRLLQPSQRRPGMHAQKLMDHPLHDDESKRPRTSHRPLRTCASCVALADPHFDLDSFRPTKKWSSPCFSRRRCSPRSTSLCKPLLCTTFPPPSKRFCLSRPGRTS